MMTPEGMRSLGENWARNARVDLRDQWLQTAEICERQDLTNVLLTRIADELTAPHLENISALLLELRNSR